MNESKHTPGPWRVEEWNAEGLTGFCFSAGGYRLPLSDAEGDIDEAEANARLIARAPDLAAEVERLRQEKDGAYEERNRVVAAFARAAVSLGWPVAVTRTAIEGWSEDWHGCIYIVTPAGQASWHFHDSHAHLFADLPRGAMAWDGHTTPEKYERLHGMRLAENAELRRKVEALREALRFYAQREHFALSDANAWDTVSGEPQNYWCDDAGTATVEDGAIARAALAASEQKGGA